MSVMAWLHQLRLQQLSLSNLRETQSQAGFKHFRRTYLFC
jgi:hypothetical protein